MNSIAKQFKILNSIGEGVICLNDYYIITYINKAGINILERTEKSIINSKIDEIIKIRDHEDFYNIEAIINNITSNDSKNGFKNNSYIEMDDNVRKYLSATIAKVDSHDDFQIVITLREINRQKKYEFNYINEKKKLDSIIRAIPLGIFIIDIERRVRYMNPFAKNKIMYPDNSENIYFGNIFSCPYVLNKKCGSNIECSECVFNEKINDSFAENKITNQYATKTQNANGTSKEYSISYIPIINSEKSRMIVLLHDITEQVHHEKLLEQARMDAEETSNLKSQFLANMTHEIRTPLNGIIGMIDLTAKQVKDIDLIENMEIARSSSENLLYIINNVLDYSKLEAHKVQIYENDFNMKQIFDQIYGENIYKAVKKNIELDMNIEISDNEIVYGDEMRLTQILNNLVDNAIKFTDTGSVTIKAKESSSINDYNHYTVKIVDTGIGISNNFQETMFNSFTQADASYTRVKGGTGLGLAITIQLCKLMNAKLDFRTEFGIGTTFEVNIELKKCNKRLDSGTENRISNADKKLFTEDDLINQIVLSNKLKAEGHNFDIVNDSNVLSTNNEINDDIHKKISLLSSEVESQNYDNLEKNISYLKNYFSKTDYIDLKDNLFRTELDLRKEEYKKLDIRIDKIKQLYNCVSRRDKL